MSCGVCGVSCGECRGLQIGKRRASEKNIVGGGGNSSRRISFFQSAHLQPDEIVRSA